MATGKNLLLIQCLRGMASLLVVLMHTTFAVNDVFGQSFLFDAFQFGGAGVDIFFVLSGFIITYTSLNALDNSGNFMPFIRKRAVRIFPAYWIVITLFLLLQVLLPSFYRSSYNFTAGNILNTYLLLPEHTMVNGVSWTLTYELFFYFLFSLAFIIRNRRMLFVLVGLYTVCLLLSPLFIQVLPKNEWLKLVLFPMNIEFFMGILSALVVSRLSKRLSVIFIITGTVLFVAAAIYSNAGYRLIGNELNRAVLFGIASFFIITGVVRYEISKQVYIHNGLVILGEASYSLYLIHLPLVIAGTRMLVRTGITGTALIHIAVAMLVLAICIVSILFFKMIERPVINILNKALSGKKKVI